MKYRFKILWRDESMKRANELLNQLDLGCGEIGIENEITFTGQDEEVSVVKKKLRHCFESQGSEILNIEGGKVE